MAGHKDFAVSVMRRAKPELGRMHTHILKQDPGQLFDKEAIRKNAREGDMAFDNADPILLTIASTSRTAPMEEGEPLACAVCRGSNEAMKFASKAVVGAGAFTMFEVTTSAHTLSAELRATEPRRRGRSS